MEKFQNKCTSCQQQDGSYKIEQEENKNTFSVDTFDIVRVFLKPALISGSLIAVLSLLSLVYTSLGITGIILATGLVQLSYNNWKWPVMVCKDLNSNYMELIKIGFFSLRAWFFRHYKASFPK